MVSCFCSCKKASSCSVGHNNQDKLENPKNRTPASAKYTKEDFLNNDKVLHRFVLPGWSQSSQTCRLPRRPLRSIKITSIHTVSTTDFNRTLFAASFLFVGTSTSIRKTRQPKIPCLGLSSRLFFKRVWVIQRLPCIPSGVALDKTLSTSGRKFKIRRLTSSSIHLYQVWYWQGSRRVRPHSIFLRRTQALGQGPEAITQERARQLGRISQKIRLIASNLSPSSEKWISVVHKVIVSPILLWPYSRPPLLRILETSPPPPPKRLSTSPHTCCFHIPRGPTTAVWH